MKLVPTTPLAIRVAALCKRKPQTPWSPKEVAVYRRLVKAGFFNDLADLELIEQYYAFQRKRGDCGPNRGCHRRGLSTFLNNAAEELDRANHWREAHPIMKPPRVIIPMPPTPSEPWVAPTDPNEIAAMIRFQREREERKQRQL